MPSVAFRQGDFSGGDIVHDPLTWDGTERQPFANNVIPESRFDRVTNIMRNWYPDPDNADATRNYTFVTPRNQDFHKFDIRYDQNLTSTDNFFVRWSSQEQNIGSTPRYPAIPDFGSMSRGGTQNVTSNNTVASYQKVWSPSLITAFRAGWNYLDTDIESHLDIAENINAKLGIPGFNQHLRGTNEMTLTGYSAAGQQHVPAEPDPVPDSPGFRGHDLHEGQPRHQVRDPVLVAAELHRQPAAHDGNDLVRRALHRALALEAAAGPGIRWATSCSATPASSGRRTRST